MKVFSDILRFFSLKDNKQTLETVDPETLRKEQIFHEQCEVKLTREIENLEKQKEEFFQKGVNGGSERQKLQIARKIKQIDRLVLSKDRQLSLISKNLQIVNSIAQLKENERWVADLGLRGVVANMDLVEVQSYVEQATVEGQFQMDRFTNLLRSIEDVEGLYEFDDDETDTMAIVEAMNMASIESDSVNLSMAQANESFSDEKSILSEERQ